MKDKNNVTFSIVGAVSIVAAILNLFILQSAIAKGFASLMIVQAMLIIMKF